MLSLSLFIEQTNKASTRCQKLPIANNQGCLPNGGAGKKQSPTFS